jgi:hypothetical protein
MNLDACLSVTELFVTWFTQTKFQLTTSDRTSKDMQN